MMSNLFPEVLWIFVAIILAFYRTEGACPSNDAIKPCTCTTTTTHLGHEFSFVNCENIESEYALTSILSATKGIELYEFRLEKSSIRYLPHDAFVGTTFHTLGIIDSSIISLSDSDIAFEGLEEKLNLIEIVNCSFVNSWDWSQLSHLDHLNEIIVRDSDIMDITDSISEIQHLDIEGMMFQKNKIEWLDDHVFLPFLAINHVFLDNNLITTLKRSMFPKPAKLLRRIGLSHNKLSSLPSDLFIDMPALRSIYLNGNPFRTIDETVFKPIWKQIYLFIFHDTALSCDCRLMWITKEDNSDKIIHAHCQNPPEFKGRQLNSLKSSELWC